MSINTYNIKSISWISVIIACCVYLTIAFINGIQIESNILKLLPENQQDAATEKAINEVTNNISKKVVFLIGHTEKEKAALAADIFYKNISATNLFSQISYIIGSDIQKRSLPTLCALS